MVQRLNLDKKGVKVGSITLKLTRKGSRGYQVSSVPIKTLESLKSDSLIAFYDPIYKRIVIMGEVKV